MIPLPLRLVAKSLSQSRYLRPKFDRTQSQALADRKSWRESLSRARRTAAGGEPVSPPGRHLLRMQRVRQDGRRPLPPLPRQPQRLGSHLEVVQEANLRRHNPAAKRDAGVGVPNSTSKAASLSQEVPRAFLQKRRGSAAKVTPPDPGRLPAAQQPARYYAPEWAITNYVEHNFWKNQASLNIRNEFVDDIKGQRTGTPGRYEEHMVGFGFWVGSTSTFRPEVSFTKYYGPWGLRALDIAPGSAVSNLQNGNYQQGKTYAPPGRVAVQRRRG